MRAIAALSLFVCVAGLSYAEDWNTVHSKGVEAMRQGDYEKATTMFRTSVSVTISETLRAVSENDLGIALSQAGHPAEAKTWLERALAAWTGLAFPHYYAQTAAALAGVERNLGDYAAAKALLSTALNRSSSDVATRSYLLATLGDILREEGNYAEARKLLNEADGIADVPWRQRMDVKISLAELNRDAGDFDASIEDWNGAATLARDHSDASAQAACDRGLGQTWLDRGSPSRAEPLLRAALARFENEPVRREAEIATAQAAMGQLYMKQEKFGLAEEAFQKALASEEKGLGATHPQTALVLEFLAETVARRNEMQIARGYLDRAESIMSARFGENSVMAASVFVNRGVLEQRAGNRGDAAAQFRKALDALGNGGPEYDAYRVKVTDYYAVALKATHHKREADAALASVSNFRSK